MPYAQCVPVRGVVAARTSVYAHTSRPEHKADPVFVQGVRAVLLLQ